MSTFPNKVYGFGTFRLDDVERVLWRGEELLVLPPKVFDTLWILVEKKGRVVSKSELMEAIWAGSFVEESNLSQNIYVLRRTLGVDEQGRQFIETVPRRGYRFAAPVTLLGVVSNDGAKQTEEVALNNVRKLDAREVKDKNHESQSVPDTHFVGLANEHHNTTKPAFINNHPNNLPSSPTPLVGRESELSFVEDTLQRIDVRLVTLTGPGGAGKTRLALQVATNLLQKFADGVCLVSLAGIIDPASITSAIAQALNVKETSRTPLAERVKQFVSKRHMLMVIDNFEHVISAAPIVAELLVASTTLKILVTSREALRLRGEHEFLVPPLALPDIERLPSNEMLAHYAAIGMFVQCARAVKRDFAVTDENARAVAQICRQLDGLPLAIELAAARIKHLSPQLLLAKLDHRLNFLTGGARDLPGRQQTMRETIAWSYVLLSDEEKSLYRRLSIFVGGCTFEAAAALGSMAGDQRLDLLDGLASLADKSLLQRVEQTDGGSRFVMLETIREYGLEQLQTSGQAKTIRRQHAAFFLGLAMQAEPELRQANQIAWLEHLEAEHSNLRAAFEWLLENDPQAALRLTVALAFFYVAHNRVTEGRESLQRALQQNQSSSVSERVKALSLLGYLARRQEDISAARSFFEQSLILSQEDVDQVEMASSLNGMGLLALEGNNYVEARLSFEKGLAISRASNDKWVIADSLNNLGEVARLEGEFESSRSFHEESLAIFREIGEPLKIGYLLTSLGDVARQQGTYESSQSLYQEALVLLQAVREKQGIAIVFSGLADLAVTQGQQHRAGLLLGAANSIYDEFGFWNSVDRAVHDQATAAVRASMRDKAFASALEEGRAMPLEQAIAYALTSLQVVD